MRSARVTELALVLVLSALPALTASAQSPEALTDAQSTTVTSPQSDVGIRAPEPPTRVPRPETTRPGNAGDDSGRGARYAPSYIGPTARGQTTEAGFSGWIAPGVRPGSPQPGGDTGGWAAFGMTFSWGGPPRRPSAPPAAH